MSADDVFEYYERTQVTLTKFGYDVFIPMFGKNSLRTELKFKAQDYRSLLSTNHAIYNRDKWMVMQSDVLYANLLNKTDGPGIVSIGSMFELAWGSYLHKQNVVVMEKENIHRHAFVLEASTIIFETELEALDYLECLAAKKY